VKQESEQRVRGLLEAYQEVLEAIEELPVVVWVPWDRKGMGRYFKVPYLRWSLAYFVEHHIGRSLGALGRRFNAIAALSDDPDADRSNRGAVELYLRSLPKPPYSVLVFAAVLAALVIALPLHAFGNVLYVLDIVGALLRFNVGYLGRALEGDQLGPTMRSVIVLLVGLTVVGAVLTSPFGLKRILFNLHPWSRERLDSTAARSHGYRAEGLYALEDGVFGEAGIRRPKEGRWDLRVPDVLAHAPAGFRAMHGGPDPRHPHVVEHPHQRGHWIVRPCPLLLAGSVLALLRRVYRARVSRVRPPPQTTRRGLEEAEPKRDRLTQPSPSMQRSFCGR
jgi:hypothetical protein